MSSLKLKDAFLVRDIIAIYIIWDSFQSLLLHSNFLRVGP